MKKNIKKYVTLIHDDLIIIKKDSTLNTTNPETPILNIICCNFT